jgi:hypothetical protein
MHRAYFLHSNFNPSDRVRRARLALVQLLPNPRWLRFIIMLGSRLRSCLTNWVHLPTHHKLFIHSLRLFWITVVLWLELGTFDRAFRSCQWPVPQPTKDDVCSSHLSHLSCSLTLIQPDSPPRTSNILLIADPQILNSRSYPDRSAFLSRITQFIVDFNLRKSWRLVAMRMRPHVVVFLGDMMDGGRGDIGDDE